MDSQEFILISSDKVRRDSSLMAFYVDLYFQTFGKKPQCAGCTFNSDFNRLKIALSGKKSVNLSLNKKEMENTYKLKKIAGRIIAFKKGKATHRLYDNNLNENFVIGYLTYGTDEEIAERKKLFSKLPKLAMSEEVEIPVKKTRKKRNSNG